MSRVLPSRFDNLSLGQLADSFGELNAQLREFEKRRDALRQAILDRAPKDEVIGQRFSVTINTTTRTSLDLDAVREKLGPEWIARHSKAATITSLRASVIASAAMPRAA
jgi:hypothetical protein